MHYQLKAGVAAEGEPDLTWLKTRACASCTLVSLVPPPEMLLRDNARMLLWSHSDGSIRALSRMLFDGGSTSLATGWQCSVCEAPLETSDEFRARTKLSIAGIPRPGPGAMEMVLDGNGKTARSSGPADIVYAAAIILSRRGIRIGADEDPLRTSAVVWQPRKPARSAPRAPREALSTPPPPPLPPSPFPRVHKNGGFAAFGNRDVRSGNTGTPTRGTGFGEDVAPRATRAAWPDRDLGGVLESTGPIPRTRMTNAMCA